MRYLRQLTEVASEGWKDLFEDHVIAEATVDRLPNPSEVTTLKVGSFRERSSKKTIKIIKKPGQEQPSLRSVWGSNSQKTGVNSLQIEQT